MKRSWVAALALVGAGWAWGGPAGAAAISSAPTAGGPMLHAAGAVAGPGLPTLSYNWSGYAVTSSQPFNYVHSQFVQPAVSCTGAHNRWTANWVGFDGFNNGTVEQDGTFAHCGGPKAATPIYEAWYEMYPNPSVFVFPVHAGDVMDTTASYAGGKFTLTVSDLSSGRTSSNVAVCGVCTRSSAEWIVERPALCNSAFCYITALADFRTTTMTGDVAGVVGGTAKPVSAFTNYAIFMVQPLSKGFISLDNVGPFRPALDAFTTTWYRAGGIVPLF